MGALMEMYSAKKSGGKSEFGGGDDSGASDVNATQEAPSYSGSSIPDNQISQYPNAPSRFVGTSGSAAADPSKSTNIKSIVSDIKGYTPGHAAPAINIPQPQQMGSQMPQQQGQSDQFNSLMQYLQKQRGGM